ncbi:hypothetical protein STA3757_16340 [Stanieria sp. NIES-3757]|nr:hypothetical protein STA3757_16340 [Stanieria sp. NIES-3757]
MKFKVKLLNWMSIVFNYYLADEISLTSTIYKLILKLEEAVKKEEDYFKKCQAKAWLNSQNLPTQKT